MSNFMVNPKVWTTEYIKRADYRTTDRTDTHLGFPTAFRLDGDFIEVFFKRYGWIRFTNVEESMENEE
jgi:hypothetical protein